MNRHLEQCTIYAVDFDGTLCEHKFPDIGAPNMKLIKFLIAKRKAGDKVILWTNRVGDYLKRAVEWSNDKGLFFDAVNENIPEIIERYKDILKDGPSSPKVTADIFIDDAACSEGLPFNSPGCNMDECWNDECKYYDKCQSKDDSVIWIKDIKLNSRTHSILILEGIKTLYQLSLRKESELRKIYGIGDVSIREIKNILSKHDLTLMKE